MQLNHRKDFFTQKSLYEDRKQFFSQSPTTSAEVKVSGIVSEIFKNISIFLKPIFYLQDLNYSMHFLQCFAPTSYMIPRQGWSTNSIEQEEEQISESELLCGYMSMITHKADITHSRNDCVSNATSFCNVNLPSDTFGTAFWEHPCKCMHWGSNCACNQWSMFALAVEFISTLNYFKHFTSNK